MQKSDCTEHIISEIKQFVVYFSYIMDRVVLSQTKDGQQMSKDELQLIQNTKYQINDFYNHFQMNQNRSIVPLIKLCVKNIILNETYPTNLLRVTIKMLTQVFKYGTSNTHFHDQKSGQQFNPDELCQSLMELQFDDHSNTIDTQEQLWLNIQTLLLKILIKLQINNDCCLKVIGFFLKFLNWRGFTCDQRQGQTIHFTDKLKKNTLKLLGILFDKGYQTQAFKTSLFEMVMTAIQVMNQPIELDEQKQPKISLQEKKKINEKQIKIICFGLKTTHELLQMQSKSLEEFIQSNINFLIQMTCSACEQEDLIIKNQGQMLFSFLMQQIIKNKMPLREQFEILYVKCVLKPILNRIKKFNEEKLKESQINGNEQALNTKDTEEQLSDQDENEEEQGNQPVGDPLLHASSYGEKEGDSKDNQGQIVDTKKIIDINSDIEFEICYNFLVEVILELSAEDLGLLFLSYDCQHFSENIITKSLKLIIKYGRYDQKKFTRIFERISHVLAKLQKNENLEEQIIHMTHQRIKYMLDTKSQQKTLARQCNIKPKLFLNKCQEIYGLVDESAPWDIASKILLFSREVNVEHVTEIVGGKDERNKAIYGYFLDKQDFKDNSLEKSLRRVMQTFRLAGVESQCVTRVLEGFGAKFYQYDKSKQFVDSEEAYEMAFLMIVLQTTEHNPNIKQKLRLKDFEITAKSNCPKSYDNLPPDYVKVLFENIKAEEISSPLSRNWYNQEFNQADLTYCQIKLSSFEEEKLITSNEFINLADLTSSQLFNFNNRFDCIKQDEISILIFGALRNVVTMLTKEFLKTSELQNPRDKLILRNLMRSNQTLMNYGFTDKLIRGMAKIENNSGNVLREIINNFDKGAQNTVTLIPQLIIGNKCLPDIGKIDKGKLLEICQAAERYFRKKLSDSQTDIKRKIMTLEGKTPQEIDEEIKRSKNENSSSGITNSKGQNDADQQSSYSFVNIVFNYFNDSSQDDLQGENGEQIQKLKHKAEKLKNDQIEHMRYMNKMFADLVNSSSGQQDEKQKDEDKQQIWQYLQTDMLSILQKILSVFKDNLHQIVQSRDGLFCLLFIKNCIETLNQEEFQVNQRKECLDLIWQEMHSIMSKLSNTKKKVQMLGQSSGQYLNTEESISSEQRVNEEDMNLSQLDTEKSEDLNISQGKNSSEQSSSLNQDLNKQIQTYSEGSKVNITYMSSKTKSYERRVFQSLCKHLILETYFDINKLMIENISGISHPNADKESVEQNLKNPDIQKDLNEAIREVQRVFKSIVNGPQNKNEDDSDVQEEDQLIQSRMFDDLHAIICMNRLLGIDFKYMKNDHESRLLPISYYSKIYKLLRNLIINSCASVDETQIEVYVQNSDTFIDVITNCLKYITQQMMTQELKIVPYHLISLLVQLIGKISTKSHQIHVADPIPQFLNIFERIFKIMNVQNQFDLWIEIMRQYQLILILNKDLVTQNHEGTINHVLAQYKNQVMQIQLDIFGEPGQKQFDLNMQKMFEDLFYQVTMLKISSKIDIKNPNKEVIQKLRLYIKIHLEQTTDVLIQMLHQIFSFNLDDDQFNQLFVSLWFPYLRTQLTFVEQMRELAPSVKENVVRILQFLMSQNILDEGQPKIWNESWNVVSSFFPDIKASLLQNE